jgi:hypothetical protein
MSLSNHIYHQVPFLLLVLPAKSRYTNLNEQKRFLLLLTTSLLRTKEDTSTACELATGKIMVAVSLQTLNAQQNSTDPHRQKLVATVTTLTKQVHDLEHGQRERERVWDLTGTMKTMRTMKR